MWSANKRLAADWRDTGYVDGVGMGCYLSRLGSTFASTVALDGRRIEVLTGKPVLLAETAAGARPGNEPGKIREFLAGVRRDHLLGLVWSDGRKHGSPAHPDWRLEANPAALPALKADAAS